MMHHVVPADAPSVVLSRIGVLRTDLGQFSRKARNDKPALSVVIRERQGVRLIPNIVLQPRERCQRAGRDARVIPVDELESCI